MAQQPAPDDRQEREDEVCPGGATGEWRALSHALLNAFAGSTDVSPDHPAASALACSDAAKLHAELAHRGVWQPGAYTRTMLLESEHFIVLLLCWSPSCESPVHAHSDAMTKVESNCFMLILEGELEETLYPPAARLCDGATSDCRGQVERDAGTAHRLPVGQAGYINDAIGLHKVGNASMTQRAISLHVYAPAWSAPPLFDEVDAGGAPFDVDAWGDF